MPNAFPKWKYALVAFVLAAGLFFALPNWFGKSPAVQLQFADNTTAQATINGIAKTLADNKIPYSRLNVKDNTVDVLFAKTDEQIQARDALAAAYPKANAAVNLLSNTPNWLQSIGLGPMNLGLDLRGGVSFLLQVDSKELFDRKSNELIDLSRSTLEKANVPLSGADAAENGGAVLWFADDAGRSAAQNALFNVFPAEVQRTDISDAGHIGLRLAYTEAGINAFKRRAADQNRMRMAGRVNSLGVAEPSIQVVGDDRILVQLPGIQDVNKAKELLGSTATLEFYLVDESGDAAAAAQLKRAPFGDKLAYFEDGRPILLKRRVIMSGEHIVDASAGFGQGQGSNGGPQVDVVLDSAGGAQMAEITRENLYKAMATVYVEYTPATSKDANGNSVTTVEKHETVVNSATIQGQFSNRFQITGVTPIARAQKLAATLRAGSLVAPVYIIEERTIGPSAGQKNIDQGINASLLGLALIALFVLAYYRKLGVIAIVTLTANLVLLVALMSLLGATLTLPGIAGIVLTLGMAVDANVLIYERIREELREGLTPKDAARAGFANALSTIVDANITTLIVAILLFSFGSGPIKGFAVTLSVGILTSMFTAIMLTRALVEFFMLRKAQPKINL